jgi:hypothetical protein
MKEYIGFSGVRHTGFFTMTASISFLSISCLYAGFLIVETSAMNCGNTTFFRELQV